MENNRSGRLVSVLVSPAKSFRSIADRPTWLTAILVLVLCGQLAVLTTVPKLDWEASISYRLEQRGRELPPAEEEAVVRAMEESGVARMLVAAAVLPWIFLPLGAAIFVGAFRLMGSELRFKTSLGVLAHGVMPTAVAVLLSIPVLLGVDEITVQQLDRGVVIPNLAILAGENPSPALLTVLASVDLFSLWSIVLLVIGYSIAAKVSKWRAAACVVGLWLVLVAGIAGLASVDRMLGS